MTDQKIYEPRAESLNLSYWVLRHTQNTAQVFLDQFDTSRGGRRGANKDAEDDLLRAMVVMASAGLDSMLKHIVENAMDDILMSSNEALKKAKKFVKSRLVQERDNPDFLSRCLMASSPGGVVKEVLVRELTSNSLQSYDQIREVCSHFGINIKKIAKKYQSKLTTIFKVRNRIIHELDIDFQQSNRNRVNRNRDKMVSHASTLIQLGSDILEDVDSVIIS